MHKTPYPLLRGVRDGTRCSSPFTVFSEWKRSSSCRHLNNTHVCPCRRGRVHFSRFSQRQPYPPERVLTISLPPPVPTRKTIHNLPKMSPPQDLLITNVVTRDRFPGQCPSTNQLNRLRRGFVPGTNKRPRVCVVKNTHLSPPVITRETTKSFPTPNVSLRGPRDGQGPPVHPTQSGGNPSIYPSFPGLV